MVVRGIVWRLGHPEKLVVGSGRDERLGLGLVVALTFAGLPLR